MSVHKRIQGMVSIIVPVYNLEGYLEKCIQSIFQQTYDNFECILVDDGSVDNSSNICDKWAKEDQRFHVIHQSNQGAAAARNAGLNVSCGEYIAFVDADDDIDSKMCENLVSALRRNSAECAVGGLIQVNDQGMKCDTQSVDREFVLSGKAAIKALYINNDKRFNIVGPCGKIFRYSMWENIRFTSGIYYEDLELMPYLYWNCEKRVCIPYAGYSYLQRKGSASHGVGVDDKRFSDSLTIRSRHAAFYREKQEKELEAVSLRRLLDLIITADRMGWIPEKEKVRSKEIYTSCYKRIVQLDFIGLNARYTMYRLFGKAIFGLIDKC